VSVTAPPRPPGPSSPVDRDELAALVEALIEEARRRARRRRLRNGAGVLLAVVAGGGLYFGLAHVGGGSTGAATAVASAGDAAATARSTGGRWGLPHGPEGGPGNTVAVAPSAPETVYLGTGRGVFRSANGGRNWTSAGLVPPPSADGSSVPGVTALLVDPRVPSTVYAGLNSQWDGGKWSGGTTYRRAVYKTTNGGRTWRALGLIGQPVAISPTGPPTLYAAAGGPGGTSRLLRSVDGGCTWQPADQGLPASYLWALAFDPTTPGTIYAAMGQRGIFKSSDSGTRWHAVRPALSHREVTAIAVDPDHPQTLYAGADVGVIKSLDGGRSWRMANAAMGGHGRDRGYKQVTALIVDNRSSRTLYATTGCAGVFKSTDAGRSWASANAGLKPRCPWSYALALNSQAPQVIYAADQVRGVLKSVNGGARWYTTNKGLSLTTVFSLAVDPTSPRTVYASAGPLGLFKSSDTGAHWRPLTAGPKLVDGIVAVDPSNPRNILAVAAAYGVLRSTDAGGTWTGTHFGANARRVSVVALSGTTAYAGTSGLGVFGSTDGGRSWRSVGLPGAHVAALAISPANSSVVYAAVWGSQARGLYESTDGGSSWQRLTYALDLDLSVFALDPKDPATVYIGTGGAHSVLKSTDQGATWHASDSGLPQWRIEDRNHPGKWITLKVEVSALAIDPVHPAMLYAATRSRGVFRSTDSGTSWHPFNAALTDYDVRALAVSTTGQTLYAATSDGGVVSLLRFAG
jgi:photosystem II stability/assembly factor-like uncharacterized protein